MISVCIASHNGQKYIREQLTSILSQISDDDEVIISDDGSNDTTLDIIESIKDKRIKIYRYTQEKAIFSIDYCTHNFENALKHAKGDIVFLSDQDDVWLPNKVETMLAKLKLHDLVMSDCYVTDNNLNITNSSYCNNCKHFSCSILSNFYKSSFLGSCMAFHSYILEKAFPFPKYGVAHDLWLGLVSLKFYNVGFINTPLILYRRHNSTITNSGEKNTTRLFFKIKYRYYILKAIITRILFAR